MVSYCFLSITGCCFVRDYCTPIFPVLLIPGFHQSRRVMPLVQSGISYLVSLMKFSNTIWLSLKYIMLFD